VVTHSVTVGPTARRLRLMAISLRNQAAVVAALVVATTGLEASGTGSSSGNASGQH
jgi:hypothetical protein